MAINQLELTNKLIACPSMSSAGSRAGVVRALPDYIQHSITLGVTSSGTQEVLSIVQTCMKFPNGLDNLIDVVRFFDKGTYPFIALEEYMRQAQLESPIAPPVTNQPTTGNYSSSVPNAASDKPKLSVFLAYADADVTQVEQLYDRLVEDGFKPWMVSRNVEVGESPDEQSQRAITNADVVIVFLSKAITQRNALNMQIKLAIKQYSYQPPGSIFLIPVMLEALTTAQMPHELEGLLAVESGNYERLLKSLQKRATDLGKSQPNVSATNNPSTSQPVASVNSSVSDGGQAANSVSAPVARPQKPSALNSRDKQTLAELLQDTNAFVNDPRGFLGQAGIPREAVRQMNFRSSDEVAANSTIDELIKFGRINIAPYKPALGSLIEYLLDRGGGKENAEFLQDLLAKYDQIIFPDDQARSSLESIVASKQDQKWRSAGFLVTGAQKLRAVCRVETSEKVLGTGFLVAPDLVLTNQHVLIMGSGNTDTEKAQSLIFRFGYLKDAGQTHAGEVLRPVPTEKALVTASPFGSSGLDFALIRLQASPGDKFGTLEIAGRELALDEDLLILQHPVGWDMQFMLGKVKVYDAAKNRMRHDVNTLGGSSGSPIFDSDWRVVALHCAGGATSNEGVPISHIYPKIAEYLPK